MNVSEGAHLAQGTARVACQPRAECKSRLGIDQSKLAVGERL